MTEPKGDGEAQGPDQDILGSYFGETPLTHRDPDDSDSDSDYDEEASCYALTLQSGGKASFAVHRRDCYGPGARVGYRRNDLEHGTWSRDGENGIVVVGDGNLRWILRTDGKQRLRMTEKPSKHQGHWPSQGVFFEPGECPEMR